MTTKSAIETDGGRASISRAWASALGLLAAAIAALVVACSAQEGPSGLGGGFGPGNTPGLENCENGATRECGVKVGEQDGVLTCYMGTQVCVGNVWQACGNGSVIETQSLGSGPGTRFQALSSSQQCTDNPCDPYCQNYKETPDGGVVPEAGPPLFDWQGGSLSSYPSGLVTKGLKEPCSDGYDCQFNHQCQNPTTGASCAHSKCQVGEGLDPSCDGCVAEVCAADPTCCDEIYEHSCSHSPCSTGSSLKASCDDCVAEICDEPGLAYCCQNNKPWDSACVAAVNSVCGLSCPLDVPGNWTQSCVDKAESICNVQCGESPPSSCSHNPCSTGAALDGTCHECVSKICKVDPYCCIVSWDGICQGEVASVCGESCPLDLTTEPPSDGQCVAWGPGQVNTSCDSWDVALGVPCTGQLPVCNHGTKEAPAGLKIVHYPANAGHYPSCDPGTQGNMQTCTTTEPIPPGKCINVTCGLTNGNREIMVNPGSTVGGTLAGECSCRDNWTLYSGTATCGAPACSGGESEAIFKDVHLIFMMDKSGSMEGERWNGTTKALKAFFSDSGSAGLYASLEFFPLSSGGSAGDGCGTETCGGSQCSNPMVADGVLTAAAAPTDAQEQKLINAINSLSPSGGTPTEPALVGALEAAVEGTIANPGDIYVVVLVTDGEPTQCNTSTYYHSELALSAYINYGVRTYAISMEGASVSALHQLAKAGGTGSAFVVGSGNVEQDLITAFKAIAGQNVNCSFTVENPDNIDPQEAKVV